MLDVHTGEIRAMASLPAYDPNHVAESLADEDSPMINRALWPYSVGSTFKVLVAATAIEQGYAAHTHDCPGYIQIGDTIFRCHNLAGHGLLNMTQALEKSCNPYFVSLIMKTGGESVAYKASVIGFGSSLELADGITASAGRLPTYEELAVPGQTANFGFGQGYLTATPLQVAQLMATISNDGAACQECEDKLKEEVGVTSRCMPFKQEKLADTCVYCGKPATKMVYWGKAY